MDEQDWLAEHFEEHRTRLRAVAYRMLGSLSEADDAVQEAWLRLSRTDASEVENLGGWLTTVVARVSLNMLRSRSARREEPLDVHVPEPIVDRADGTDPEHEALLADSVGLALLVVLETLIAARAAGVRAARHVRACRSTRSRRSSTAPPRRRASSPAAPAAASRGRAPSPTPTSTPSARSSTPSSRPRARATSTRCSRCSTRTSCCEPTSALPAGRGRSAARRPSPARRCSSSRVDLEHAAGARQRRGRRGHAPRRPAVLGRRFTVRNGKIVEMDFLADPERLAGST